MRYARVCAPVLNVSTFLKKAEIDFDLIGISVMKFGNQEALFTHVKYFFIKNNFYQK